MAGGVIGSVPVCDGRDSTEAAMVLGRRVGYTLRWLVVLSALYRCVMAQYINWFVPSSENERVFGK